MGTKVLNIIGSKSKYINFFLPKGGGGGTKGLNIIGFKSNSITFYRSLGMRNHIETQKRVPRDFN